MVSVKTMPIALFRKFLTEQGCNLIGTKGGHEKWSRLDLKRPIIFPVHGSKTIPLFIVLSNLKTMNITKQVLEQWIKENPK